MRFRYAYGRLVPADPPRDDDPIAQDPDAALALRPSEVIDDVLGWRADDDEYLRYMLVKYARLHPIYNVADPAAARSDALAFVVPVSRMHTLMPHVAPLAAQGVFPAQLAEYLGEVRREAGGVIELPDWLALTAWCLNKILDGGPVQFEPCPNCGYPWIPGRAQFCNRPAPGRKETCRRLRAHQAYTDRNGDFHRERKKLYERKRRRKLSDSEYADWIDHNRPGAKGSTWVPFKDWQAGKRPRKGRTDGKRR